MTMACLIDVDGTLVHYPGTQDAWGQTDAKPDSEGLYTFHDRDGGEHKVIKLPVSTSLQQGIISIETLNKLSQLRAAGIPVILLSGARTATLLQRIPFLPVADAYVTENGGRVFYPQPNVPAAMFLSEDLEWRRRHDNVVGPSEQETIDPEKRAGDLWDLYRFLKAEGWTVDCLGYSTCLRVKSAPAQKSVDDLQDILNDWQGVQSTFNLGKADLYATTSGKENAAKYLLDKFSAELKLSVFLCDDDNDMALAKEVGHAYLPSIATESVRQEVDQNPSHFTVIQDVGGTMATEAALDAVLDYYAIGEMNADSDDEKSSVGDDAGSGQERPAGTAAASRQVKRPRHLQQGQNVRSP